MTNEKLNIELFISSHCPHCAQTLTLLTAAIKDEDISVLKIINLNTIINPDAYPHIRSVPFIQIGDFEFPGELKKAELDDWVSSQKEGNFASNYFTNLLMNGQISQVEHFIKRKPDYWLELIKLAQDSETKMQVRIGITALFESSSNDIINITQADEIISALIEASNATSHAIRVDLIYFLSLLYNAFKATNKTHAPLADFIKTTLNDPSDEIKEILEDVAN